MAAAGTGRAKRRPNQGSARPPRASCGFSLIEVLAGAAIVAISLLGMAAATSSSHQLIRDSRSDLTILRALETVSAEVSATPFDQVATQYHMQGFAIEGVTAPAADLDGTPGAIVFHDAPVGVPNSYEVEVSVGYLDSAGRTRARTMRRILSNVRGDPGDPVPLATLEQYYGSPTVTPTYPTYPTYPTDTGDDTSSPTYSPAPGYGETYAYIPVREYSYAQ